MCCWHLCCCHCCDFVFVFDLCCCHCQCHLVLITSIIVMLLVLTQCKWGGWRPLSITISLIISSQRMTPDWVKEKTGTWRWSDLILSVDWPAVGLGWCIPIIVCSITSAHHRWCLQGDSIHWWLLPSDSWWPIGGCWVVGLYFYDDCGDITE